MWRGEESYRSGVNAARRALQFVNDLHCAMLGCSSNGTAGKEAAEDVEVAHSLPEDARNL
jgi:hypothetical protein